jgi:hypothetical protein
MAFTTQQREQLKLYMMDFSAARDAAITGITTAGTERETEAIRLLTRLNELEASQLTTVQKAALVGADGSTKLQPSSAVSLLRSEGARLCKALGAMMGLAPSDDYFDRFANVAPGLFGDEDDESRLWTAAL